MKLPRTEDVWALWIGLLIFALSLGNLARLDLLGWAVDARVWVEWSKALGPTSATYGLPSVAGLALMFGFLLAILSAGARVLGYPAGRFALGFTLVFWISYACWLLGHNAYIAATPRERADLGISWSLGLTGEAGYIVALIAGLTLGNFFPRSVAAMQEAVRPEWYIKAAIVVLGGSLGVKAAADTRLTEAILFRGLAAIIEAYLIYWAVIYFIARKFFGFSREWAAPLASGISICGVSAAIATGAAIRARPIVPIMVSSLVVIFSVVELLVLPFAARAFLVDEPMVASAWMGLAVKTDGAAVASGQITESLIRTAAEQQGMNIPAGPMLMTTTTVKVFIDLFIGVWAFILAIIWVYRVDPKPGERVSPLEIWQRLPKFVLGYFLTFAVMLYCALNWRDVGADLQAASRQGDIFRKLFFVMTFFTIGLVSNFKKLWQEGIGRLALVYAVGLFGFVIWVGLLISWLFFQGAHEVFTR
ncbi:MAG: putative sulfate exporter family transporter [Planctomycetes bacterium]|nr:putative sulfate exporter family transporter [Planctomycetota bacterium]